MERPEITEEKIKTLLETKYVSLYDLQYKEGAHYYDASRRRKEDLIALKSDAEFRALHADAVSCFVTVRTPGGEPRLLLFYEYRYPTGQYLLSPPAGLLDEEDKADPEPLFSAARREILEETGIRVLNEDLRVLSPLVFSSPGLTDECNALIAADVTLPDLSVLTHKGAVGTENFGDFRLFTKEEAREVLLSGRDEFGNFFSVYTYAALQHFVSDGR